MPRRAVTAHGGRRGIIADQVAQQPGRDPAAGDRRGRLGHRQHRFRKVPGQGYRPRLRPMISFWISVVPPNIDWTRLSAQARPTAYSCM